MIKAQFSEGMTLDVDQFFIKIKKCRFDLYRFTKQSYGLSIFKTGHSKKSSKKFKGPIIIDEAYGEFSDYSVVNLVKNNDNLIVIRNVLKGIWISRLETGLFCSKQKIH